MTSRSCGAEGLILGDKYRLTSILGRGAMGEVWRAEHLTLRSEIAIKLIDLDILQATVGRRREDGLARFRREALAAASLQGPHVVQVFDHGVDAGLPFIAMELLHGETLEDRLVRVGRLPHAETIRILTHVGRAMARAHEQGIVHRDLKPENVFLVDNDGDEIAKVLDFGVAKLARDAFESDGLATAAGSLLGTPGYMSPEQASGQSEVDWRTDLWAMGVLAYECVTGNRPFDGGHVGDLILQVCIHPLPVPSRAAEVPPGFDAWWAQACARDRDARFQSAREMVDELSQVLLGVRRMRSLLSSANEREPTRTLGATSSPPEVAPAARRTRKVAAALGGAVITTLGLLWVTLGMGGADAGVGQAALDEGAPNEDARERVAPGAAPIDALADLDRGEPGPGPDPVDPAPADEPTAPTAAPPPASATPPARAPSSRSEPSPATRPASARSGEDDVSARSAKRVPPGPESRSARPAKVRPADRIGL